MKNFRGPVLSQPLGGEMEELRPALSRAGRPPRRWQWKGPAGSRDCLAGCPLVSCHSPAPVQAGLELRRERGGAGPSGWRARSGGLGFRGSLRQAVTRPWPALSPAAGSRSRIPKGRRVWCEWSRRSGLGTFSAVPASRLAYALVCSPGKVL